MATATIVVALIGLALSIGGLIIKMSFFAAEQRLVLRQMQQELGLVRHIPIMIFRITRLEQQVGISHIEMPIPPGASKDV